MNRTLELMKESGAFLEGHFLLSSGKHSAGYCQCAKLLRFPERAAIVLQYVVEQVRALHITKVCGPAMGGVIVSYELARQLGVESIFTERQDGVMQLRRGFHVGPGDTVLIAEDVITTGKSTMETVQALENLGAKVIGAACIVDRRQADCPFALPVYAALQLDIKTYEANDCLLCKAGGPPPEKPGSRQMA